MMPHGNLLKPFLTTVFTTRAVRLLVEKIKAPGLFLYSLRSMLLLLQQCLEMG